MRIATKIAILGWGSLLWDLHPEFDNQHGEWKDDGPILKLEFSRISQSRAGALTLVIDETNGSEAKVSWCLSKRSSANNAIEDLRLREGTKAFNIGRLEISAREASTNETDKTIRSWSASKEGKLNAVIWTNLKSNFEEKQGISFSVSGAIDYLKNLSSDGRRKAATYIRNAPNVVVTPLRTALESERWFWD